MGRFESAVRLMESLDNFVGPVNLGNLDEFTIRQLAGKLIELTGFVSSLVLQPLPTDDPCQRCPNITLAKEKLGWGADSFT